jgi:hypothetical protein
LVLFLFNTYYWLDWFITLIKPKSTKKRWK